MLKKNGLCLARKLQSMKPTVRKLLEPFQYVVARLFRKPGLVSRDGEKTGAMRVVIVGGYGNIGRLNQNTGDEAQLAAVIAHWKRLVPGVQLTILSPNPEYTKKTHGEPAELASRITLFCADKMPDYGQSGFWFKWRFLWVNAHMLFIAWLFRNRLPLIGAYPHEVSLLNRIAGADVFHFCGGGYLTGMTLSRLWEGMMLIRVASLLNVPVILSGQTIGVFKDKCSRFLTRWGLRKAKLICLRDPEGSVKDVHSLGITGDHVVATFDDALFCDVADSADIDRTLQRNGIKKDCSYVVFSVHRFILTPEEAQRVFKRIAELCDYVASRYKLHVVFLPLHQGDVPAMQETKSNMKSAATIIEYEYDYRIAKGIMQRAEICFAMRHHAIIFAMGTRTPVVATVLDDYYLRKNWGALRLFGQEERVLDWESLFSPGVAEEMIGNCFAEREKIRLEVGRHLQKMKERDGETIRRFASVFHRSTRSALLRARPWGFKQG